MRRQSLLIAVLLCLSGCYRYAPVEIHVFDAQTKQPIVGTRVEPYYLRFMELFPPKLDSAFTDVSGVARMDICTNYKTGYAGLYVIADDCLLDQASGGTLVELPVEHLRIRNREPFRVEIGMLKLEEFHRRYR